MCQIGAFTELFAARMRQIGAMMELFAAMMELFAAMAELFAAMVERFAAMAERFGEEDRSAGYGISTRTSRITATTSGANESGG